MSERGNLVITIARQYGSGGRIIGRRLAEDLGVHFYDQEILRMTSEVSAVGEQYFRLADEKAGGNLLYRIVGGLRGGGLDEPALDMGIVKPDNLFRFQSAVIRKLAQEEPCVIVGRCADYVLQAAGHEPLIRLFVYADAATRIRRVQDVDGLDTREALKKLTRINRERWSYVHYYTGRDWEDMQYYDLPVNTGVIDLDQAVDLVKWYIALRGYGCGK
ncbi:MAG: cytidylate kinase-like family protein [Lachnospiraceae bacterium]|jgi:cytidylate kinase|nr:cytidylate kinase-like family protein [Lachnospiraceae bacterium]